MEIKATSTYDLKACTALIRSALGTRAPLNIVLFSLLTVLSLVCGFVMDSTIWFGLFPITLFGLLMTIFQFVILPRTTYQQQGDMKDATTYFLFTDDLVQTYVKTPTYEGRSKMLYAHFVKVRETKDYLFLYRSNHQAFIIDKSSLAPGDLPVLRNRLRAANIYACQLRND
ncbi:MAG: YcxB family protein [Clostridia bacterium]|nr:YcxB family protein [Clostridia bacterium]